MESPTQGELEALFDYYAEHACPCRFPRLRAAVARDFKEVGAPEWDVSDTRRLLGVFDRRVELEVSFTNEVLTEGRSRCCGARVKRHSIPFYKDSFLERAIIRPGTMSDVGAGVHGLLPICGRVFPAGPVSVRPNERKEIENAYPRLRASEWLEYMRALDS